MHSEMEYVRQFLRMNFGEEAVIHGEDVYKRQVLHYMKQKEMGKILISTFSLYRI